MLLGLHPRPAPSHRWSSMEAFFQLKSIAAWSRSARRTRTLDRPAQPVVQQRPGMRQMMLDRSAAGSRPRSPRCAAHRCRPPSGEQSAVAIEPLPGRRSPATLNSAADTVTEVGDATLSENSDPLQLALFDAEVLEQRRPSRAGPGSGGSRTRRGNPAVSARCAVLAPWTSTFLSPAAFLASRMAASRSLTYWPIRRPGGCRVAAEDVDGHTVMMVAVPAACGFEAPASGDNGPGGHELVVDLAIRIIGAWKGPLVQPVPAVAEGVGQRFVGPRDESVEGH